jgi:hypothetical protein
MVAGQTYHSNIFNSPVVLAGLIIFNMRKTIKDFPNYMITDKGKVYSKISNKYLKNCSDSMGYEIVTLYKYAKKKTRTIHRLVAEAFIENPLNKKEVNHKDGNKQNNNISNLEWVSRSENQKHAFNTGLQKPVRGENHGNSKLKKHDISAIKLLSKTGYKHQVIADYFNVSRRCIGLIIKGQRWAYIK